MPTTGTFVSAAATNVMPTTHQIRVRLALLLLGLTSWMGGLPTLQWYVSQAQAVDAVTSQTANQTQTRGTLEEGRGSGTVPALRDTALGSLQESGRTIGIATTNVQRLKIIKEFDREQFAALAGLVEQFELNPDLAKQYSTSNLPPDLANKLGTKSLTNIDPRIIRSLIYLITPENQGGAGHEFLEISSITKGHTSTDGEKELEGFTPEGESIKKSPHVGGKAADVTAIDYLHGTEFTIAADEDGKPIVKSLKRLSDKPVSVSWQDPAAASFRNGSPSAPRLAGGDPASTVGNALASMLGQGLSQGLEQVGSSLNVTQLLANLRLGGGSTIGDVSQQLGRAAVPQLLQSSSPISLGSRYALRETGQTLISQALDGQVPAFCFFGETVDELVYNCGREIVTERVGLPQGGLIGSTSREVITNAGERFWEGKLGLGLGALDGVTNRGELEKRIGRGVVANYLGTDVGSVPLGAQPADFQKVLGSTWNAISSGDLTVDNYVGIGGAKGQIASNPDEWLRQIGAKKLSYIEAYTPEARDAAFNLEQRPTILTLPTGTDQEKATALLDTYAFTFEVEERLKRIQTGQETFAANTASDDNELRAWLLDNAYDTGSDPNQELPTSRFLRGDGGAFYDTGIEVLAKAMTADNAGRSALRQYLRSGQEATDGGLDLVYIGQTLGFPERSSFDAVFRADAPVVGFSAVGRTTLARVLSQSPDEAAAQLAKPVALSPDELRTNLEAFRQQAVALRRTTTNGSVRSKIDQGLTSVDRLEELLSQNKAPASLNLSTEWRVGVARIQQAAEAIVTSAGQAITSEARNLIVAANGLLAESGSRLYTQTVKGLNLPGNTAQVLSQMLSNRVSPKQGVEQVGGAAFDQLFDIAAGDTYALNTQIQARLHAHDTAGATAAMDRFATQHAGSFDEELALIERSMTQLGSSKPWTPKDVVGLVFTPQDIFGVGADVLGTGLGNTRGQTPLSEVLRTTPADGNLTSVVTAGAGMGALTGALAGRANFAPDPSVETDYERMLYQMASNATGWEISPKGIVIRNPQAYIEGIIGRPLTPQIARDLGLTDLSAKGLEAFAKSWNPNNNQVLVGRLTQIAQLSFPNAPVPTASIIDTLFNKQLTPKERTERLEQLTRSQLESRLVDPFIMERLGIAGLPAGAVITAKNILLDKKATPAEKSAALKALGLATGDAMAQQRFGFPVSWLLDNTLDPKQKVRIGLNIAASKMGLDPAITTLVDQSWQIFFVDKGIDTSTQAGRTQLAGLMLAAGSAAKVPAEYMGVAAAFITGDVEATAIAYAGGQFNQVLNQAGIYTVSFQDIYEGLVGPTKATRDRLLAEGEVELASRFPGDAKEKYADIYDAYSKDLLTDKVSKFKSAKQEQLMFAGMDLALSKSLGIPGLGGFAHAFMRGSFTDQAAATGQLISAITGSPDAAIILGNGQLLTDMKKFVASGNSADISPASYGALDGILSHYGGIPIPPGTSEAVVGFATTGDVGKFEAVVNPDTLVAFGGGYLDQAVGLPQGSTAALYGAYQQMDVAQKAYDASKLNDLLTNQGLGGVSDATKGAAQQLGASQAGLISLGVNLVFGETFAKLDNQLGLPSGMVSTLVSTGIYAAMVPGIAIGQLLLTTVLPWAAPLLLAAIFGIDLGKLLGGLFGGGAKDKTQQIILWSSVPGRFPQDVEYNCLRKGLPAPADDPNRPKGKEVDLGDFKCEVGKQIVFAKELPPGVFYGAPPANLAQAEQFGQQQAADGNVQRLLWNLLTVSSHTDDEALIPNQIRSHSKQHGLTLQTLMDGVWGDGSVGSYADLINDDGSRRGYLYDEPGKQPFFAQHVHWNY